MRMCIFCGTPALYDQTECSGCGYDLNQKPEWSQSVEEANNLHWLAQAQRRLVLPIEQSDEIPFLAIEYSWKVLNRFDNAIQVPKVDDAETGKNVNQPLQKEFLICLIL